nr:cyclomaltodextrinase [Eubacterium sp.]
QKIDCRLGTNADFKDLCNELHQENIKVVLDGVFNHVGRGFGPFQDVLNNREQSPYCSWFYIDFGGNSPYNDGLWYEGWEGNYDLVKLNLQNEAVVSYLLESVSFWISEFDIDGIRLDVAYCLDFDFLKRLRRHCDTLKEDFFLVGEMLHGDYNQRVNEEMLHSCTNYECYKGLHSSFNSMNMFEINHSLLRQFGADPWCLYRGKHLFNFVDNHDVTRVASILNNENHLKPIYGLLFGMPGIPCVYYGSEWGATGRKEEGDPSLRLSYDKPEWNTLTDFIEKLATIKKTEKSLNYGDFTSILLTNRQCIFRRSVDGENVYIAINAEDVPYQANCNFEKNQVTDLISGAIIETGSGLILEPYSVYYLK